MILNNKEKIEFVLSKINFYQDRLNESIDAADFLNNLGVQEKIEMNQKDIFKYTQAISVLQAEIEALTSQE
jgi:hypothetical protein